MNIEVISRFVGPDFDRGIRAIVKANQKSTAINPNPTAQSEKARTRRAIIYIFGCLLFGLIITIAGLQRDIFPLIVLAIIGGFLIYISNVNVGTKRLKKALVNGFGIYYETVLSFKYTFRNEGVYYIDLGENPQVKTSEFRAWSFIKLITVTEGVLVLTLNNNAHAVVNLYMMNMEQQNELLSFINHSFPQIGVNIVT